MSNLSLSFSFYFWWLNSSQSVTLTNSLSQNVNVMPDLCVFWYGNTLGNTLEIGGYYTNTDSTYYQNGSVSYGNDYVRFSFVSGNKCVAHFTSPINVDGTVKICNNIRAISGDSGGNLSARTSLNAQFATLSAVTVANVGVNKPSEAASIQQNVYICIGVWVGGSSGYRDVYAIWFE